MSGAQQLTLQPTHADLQLQRMPPDGTVSRVVYAALLASGSSTDHAKLFAAFPNRRDLTGVCLVQENTLFNVLECHVEDMFPILRAVNKMSCMKVRGVCVLVKSLQRTGGS